MGSAHKYDAFSAYKYTPKMMVGVMSREKNGLLADESTEAMSDKNEWAGGCIHGVPIVREVVQKVCRVVNQPI